MNDETTNAVVQTQPDITPMQIMASALDKGIDADSLDKIMGLQERYDAKVQREEFNRSMGLFQQECPIIEKGDSANGRPYARMDRIWREIKPLMARCGLSVTWSDVSVNSESISITGAIRHAQGHVEVIRHTMPAPQAIKGQNAAQAAAAAETYAKRYAICSALGIQTGEDDDGAALEPAKVAGVSEIRTIKELIDATKTDAAKFCKYFQIESIDAMTEEKCGKALAMLLGKKKEQEAVDDSLPFDDPAEESVASNA